MPAIPPPVRCESVPVIAAHNGDHGAITGLHDGNADSSTWDRHASCPRLPGFSVAEVPSDAAVPLADGTPPSEREFDMLVGNGALCASA